MLNTLNNESFVNNKYNECNNSKKDSFTSTILKVKDYAEFSIKNFISYIDRIDIRSLPEEDRVEIANKLMDKDISEFSINSYRFDYKYNYLLK